MCILKYRVVSRLVAIQVNLRNQKRLVFYEKGSLQGWLGIKVKSIVVIHFVVCRILDSKKRLFTVQFMAFYGLFRHELVEIND